MFNPFIEMRPTTGFGSGNPLLMSKVERLLLVSEITAT